MSMIDRIVQVIFRGKDDVTPEANKAKAGVGGFVDSATSMLKGLAAAAAALGLGAFFKKAIEEAQTSREAMGQLALTVENSGVSFTKMAPRVDEALSRLARLSKFGDDDFAKAMQNMTLKTGDAEWALANLGPAADLAAAAGIDLEKASTVLAQAHEGNTKQLYRLIPELKGATNWQELLAEKTAGAAEAQMRQLGPIAAIQKQFGELAESVGKAILGNSTFEESGFGVATMLADLATWVEENTDELGVFIETTIEVGKNILEGLTPAFTLLKQVGGPILKLLVGLIAEMSFAFRAGTIVVEEFAGSVYKSIGNLVEKGGRVLKLFGINVVEGMGTTLRTFGEKLDAEASERWTKLTADHSAFWSRVGREGEKSVDTVRTQERAKTKIVRDESEEQEKIWRAQQKQVEETYKVLSGLAVNYKEVLRTLNPALKESLNKEHAGEFEKTWKRIDDNARTLITRMMANPLPPLIKPAADATKVMGDNLADSVDAVLGLAAEFGGLDDESKAVLENVSAIGKSVQAMFDGGVSFAGIAGVLGAVGTIVSALTSDAREYRQLQRESQARLKENSETVDKLTKQVGLLALDVAGGEVATIESVLADIVPKLSQGGSITDFLSIIKGATSQLVGSGLGWDSVVSLAKKFGLNILDSKGAIDFAQLPELLRALQGTNTAAPGTDFESQLSILQDSFDVNGTNDLSQIGQILNLAGGFAPVLQGLFRGDNLGGTRADLQKLFNDMAAGRLQESQLGRLSGNQFRQLILSLIRQIDAVMQAQTGDATGGDAAGDLELPSAGLLTGGPSLTPVTAAETVQAVLREQTDALSLLLTDQLVLQTRIALAAEGSWVELRQVNTNLGDILGVIGGGLDGLDAALETRARAAALDRGQRPVQR